MRLLLYIFLIHLPLVSHGQGNVATQYETLLEELADDSYETRNKAQDKLGQLSMKHPKECSSLLYKSYKQHPQPEVRQRSYSALLKLYKQKFAPPKKGYLGILHKPTETKWNGDVVNAVLIQSVVNGSPADAAGLQANDEILAVGDQNFTKVPAQKISNTFSKTVKEHNAGAKIEITLLRNGKELVTKATLSAYEDRLGNREDTIKQGFEKWLKTLE